MHDYTAPGRERRSSPRVGLCADVDLESNANFYAGRTRDISAGGLFVETHAALPIGAQVRIRLKLMGRSFEIASEVAWQLEDETGVVGIGVKFAHMTKSAEEAIRAFVERRPPMEFGEVEDADEPLAPPAARREAPRPTPRRSPPPLPKGSAAGPPPLPVR